MEKAYSVPELKCLERVLDAKDDCLILEDQWEGELESFTERFISMTEPVLIGKDGTEVPMHAVSHPAKADRNVNVEAYSLGLDGDILETDKLNIQDYAALRIGKAWLRWSEGCCGLQFSTGIHLHHGFKGGYDTVYLINMMFRPDGKKAAIRMEIER